MTGAAVLLETLGGRPHQILELTDCRQRASSAGWCPRAVFRDGRQSRQQRGQPILGLRAGGEPGRQGVPGLDDWDGGASSSRGSARSSAKLPPVRPDRDRKGVTWGSSMNSSQARPGHHLSGFIIVLVVVGFFAYMAMKLFPMYQEFFSVKQAMKAVAEEAGSQHQTPPRSGPAGRRFVHQLRRERQAAEHVKCRARDAQRHAAQHPVPAQAVDLQPRRS
jgi:hypothetical protein